MAIRQMAPDSHVTIVNRQSNHKKYFAEENRETNAILREMRKQNVIYQAGDFGPKPKQKPKHEDNRHRHSAGYNGPRNDQTKEQSGANNNQSNYKVTVDSSVDTAAEEKKLAEQYKKENKTDEGATAQNGDTEKQGGVTEIAGIDEGIDADENTIGSNADTVSEKSQSIPVRGIILTVVLAAIAVSGTVLFIRKKKKQK